MITMESVQCTASLTHPLQGAAQFAHNISKDPCLYCSSYHIISYHIISYHIIYHIISYHIISHHIISFHIISYHTIPYIIYHITSHQIISYFDLWYINTLVYLSIRDLIYSFLVSLYPYIIHFGGAADIAFLYFDFYRHLHLFPPCAVVMDYIQRVMHVWILSVNSNIMSWTPTIACVFLWCGVIWCGVFKRRQSMNI